MDFESLKKSSSNFDAITKASGNKTLHQRTNNQTTNIKMTGCGNLN